MKDTLRLLRKTGEVKALVLASLSWRKEHEK